MKLTILGCGGSTGVPLIGNFWGTCDPANPKNRRLRPSVLVARGETRILVDSGPDIRQQLLDAEVNWLDAVLYTHAHGDHCHGIDDLRSVQRLMERRIDAYGDEHVIESLKRRFGYVFPDGVAPDAFYGAVLEPHTIGDAPFTVGEIEILPFEQDHGICATMGFRFGPIAYSTDVVELPEAAFAALEGVQIWIVDCLRPDNAHPTHSHLAKTLGWIERVKPAHAVLTHMNHETDYEALSKRLPAGVEPAYDGMVIEADDPIGGP